MTITVVRIFRSQHLEVSIKNKRSGKRVETVQSFSVFDTVFWVLLHTKNLVGFGEMPSEQIITKRSV